MISALLFLLPRLKEIMIGTLSFFKYLQRYSRFDILPVCYANHEFLKDCGIQCYAWSILDNHFHLLLRSGAIPGKTVRARSLLCYWAAGELRMGMTGLSAQLNISVNCVSQSVARGKILAKMNAYSLTKYKG